MIRQGLGITGSAPFDFFIAQSAEYLDEVMNAFSRSGLRYINKILQAYKLDESDFTDPDWKIIEQYLGDETYDG